ncbi:AAA family ATPase [Corynebacterium crudilactis]|uniref:ATPase n=1 Tax=Corynebacterium crudilactis TaxID=1652495 RepID=A0A172QXH9_9CORY|nr:AAA family ATPase [Corynebacterium crudilactis]ANE05419.1 ATPase [Corynebacterium crudilactis]
MFLTKVELLDQPKSLPGYLSTLAIVTSLDVSPLEFHAPITVITGENGVGKSTLIEAIAVGMGLNPAGGSRHAHFDRDGDIVSSLHHSLKLVRRRNPRDAFFFRGETWYNTASYYGSLEGGNLLDLHDMSHGESIFAVIERRFHGDGFFILDEPEAGLSMLRQLELLGKLANLARNGAQIVMATHSPILLAIPGAEIVEITSSGIARVSFEEAEAVQAAREFVSDPRGTADFLTSQSSDFLEEQP